MKFLIIAIFALFSSTLFAQSICEDRIASKLSSVKFSNLVPLEVNEMSSLVIRSSELHEREKKVLLGYAASEGFEFYLMTYNGGMSATVQEIIVVRNDCKIMNRSVVYVE